MAGQGTPPRRRVNKSDAVERIRGMPQASSASEPRQTTTRLVIIPLMPS